MRKYIKLLFVIMLTFFITVSVNAEVVTQDRNELEDYGVTKKWKITETNKDNILNTPKVDASEKIYDFVGVLSDEEKQNLKKEIDNYLDKTKMDLVIVIKNLPYYIDSENETFATDFYDYNDFGLELTNYSGTVLFRNTYESDPYYDFYMFGKAQLYYQGNSRNDYILDGIFDDLHNENYYEGFHKYINYLTDYYNKGVSSDLEGYKVDENGYLVAPPRVYHIHYYFIFLFSIIVTIVIISIMVGRNRMIHKATNAEDYYDRGSLKITRREDVLLHSHTSQYTSSSSSGSSGGGGGFHSSSGSSGGGHSSGGGRHG